MNETHVYAAKQLYPQLCRQLSLAKSDVLLASFAAAVGVPFGVGSTSNSLMFLSSSSF